MNPVDYFEKKRVLITGGMGFIGSNLAHRLVSLGAVVRIVDADDPATGANRFNLDGLLDRVELRVADLRDQDVVRGMIDGQEVLFNLAGQVSHASSMEWPLEDLQINAGCHLAIVDACRKFNPGIKVVYAGTRQVYGHPRYLPVDENHPIEPVDYNGISKFAGEQFHLVAQRVHGLPACSLRMTNVYGPRMRCRDGRQTFLGVWIRRLIEGQPIPVYGSGTQVRDLNFVEDAVDALLIAAACPSSDGETYNLGSPEPVRLIDLADLMIAINGSGSRELLPFPEERRRIEIGDYHGDYGKIQSQLGWEPRVSLREGLARTLAFYRQKCEHYW